MVMLHNSRNNESSVLKVRAKIPENKKLRISGISGIQPNEILKGRFVKHIVSHKLCKQTS